LGQFGCRRTRIDYEIRDSFSGRNRQAGRAFYRRDMGQQTVGASCCGRMPKAPQVQLEVPMPYLFWAVVPFEIMKMWWDACERAREASAK